MRSLFLFRQSVMKKNNHFFTSARITHQVELNSSNQGNKNQEYQDNRRQTEHHLSLLKDGRGAKEEDNSQVTEPLKEEILKGNVHTIEEMRAWLQNFGYSDAIKDAAIKFYPA